MDNNNFNQPMGQPGMNPQYAQPTMDPMMQQQMMNQQYAQPAMDMNQQFMQPGMGQMNPQYAQPQMMNQQFVQPTMDPTMQQQMMNQQYAQPQMDMNQQFIQPTMQQYAQPQMMDQQYAQPVMETPVAPEMAAPEAPAVEAPVAPEMVAPEAPAVEAPVAPEMAAPEAPAVEAPVAPEMVAPEAPAVEAPVAPEMVAPEAPAMVDEGTTVLTGGPNFGAPVDMGNMGVANGFMPEGQQFAQPGMGVMPQGDPNMMGQPVPPMFGDVPPAPVEGGKKAKKAKKEKKKGGKGKVIGISVALAAVIAAVVCGIIFLPNLLGNPKKKVKAAFEKTFAYNVTDAQKNFAEGIAKNGGDATVDFTLKPADNLSEMAGFSNVGMNIKASTDLANKVTFNSATIKIDDSEFITVELAADENNIYVGIPDLFDGYFTLPTTNIGTALANSPFLEKADISASDIQVLDAITLNMFADSSDKADEISKKLEKMVKYKRKGKSKITVNGKNVKATKYAVSVDTDDVFDLISDEVVANMDALQMPGVDANTISTAINMVKAYFPDEFVLYVYVKDGKVVKMSSDVEINVMGQKATIEFDSEISDDAFYASVVLKAMGEDVLTAIVDLKDTNAAVNGYINLNADGEELNVDITSTKDGDNLDLKAVVSEDGYEEGTVYFKGYVKDTDYDFTVEVESDGQTIGFGAKGTVSCTDIELVHDCTEFKVLVMGSPVLTGSLKATTTVGATRAAIPTGKTYDLTQFGEAEFTTFLEENQDKVAAWLEKLKEIPIFSAIGGTVVEEPIEPEEPEVSLDDALFTTWDSDAQVKLLTIPDGLTLDSASSSGARMSVDGFNIYYGYASSNPQEYYDNWISFYVDDEDWVIDDLQEMTDSEGNTIYVGKRTNTSWEEDYIIYIRVVDDASVVYAEVYDYDNPVAIESWVDLLSSQYIQIIPADGGEVDVEDVDVEVEEPEEEVEE